MWYELATVIDILGPNTNHMIIVCVSLCMKLLWVVFVWWLKGLDVAAEPG